MLDYRTPANRTIGVRLNFGSILFDWIPRKNSASFLPKPIQFLEKIVENVQDKAQNVTQIVDVTKSGIGERGTGNGERGTGNGERGTGVWERVYSGFPHNNSKWRTQEKKNTDDKCSKYLLVKDLLRNADIINLVC